LVGSKFSRTCAIGTHVDGGIAGVANIYRARQRCGEDRAVLLLGEYRAIVAANADKNAGDLFRSMSVFARAEIYPLLDTTGP